MKHGTEKVEVHSLPVVIFIKALILLGNCKYTYSLYS